MLLTIKKINLNYTIDIQSNKIVIKIEEKKIKGKN